MYSSLIETFGKHRVLVMVPGIYVLAFHFREVREKAVPFLPMLQAWWSTPRMYGSESPRVLSRLCPQSIDIKRSHQTGGEGRNHVHAFLSGEFRIHEGGVRSHSALRDGVFVS